MRVLREGGNAVDAALAAMFTSFVTEPLLTGLGAGGYMLVGVPERPAVLLDFFVAAPGQGAEPARRAPLEPVEVDFGGAVQIYNVGASSCGTYGVPAGMCAAARRFGRMGLAELTTPAAALARDGVELNPLQAALFEILAPIVQATPESRALFMPEGRLPRPGERWRDPALGDALERLGVEGEAPFYRGELADLVCAHLAERGGVLTREDLAAYTPEEREPIAVDYRGRRVLTNPPPSSGGVLIAYALALLDRRPGPPDLLTVVEAMDRQQAERTPAFLEGLTDPGFGARFLASRLGSTTHIAVVDADGWACSVTCTNGEGSGQVVPGTGLHLNNMMGEQDLSPLGFFTHPSGRRLPSMMAPTLVLREDRPELVLGSAGSNRIRSAILQVILGVLDRGLDVRAAVEAPRVHYEDGLVYLEPGSDEAALAAAGHTVVGFDGLNLFFGGVQAVARDPVTGGFTGAGDPRRGGVALVA